MLCQIDEEPYKGLWGARVIVKHAQEWWEKSTFILKDGSWAKGIKYLEGIATRWRQPLP